jgi:hypothetical protein
MVLTMFSQSALNVFLANILLLVLARIQSNNQLTEDFLAHCFQDSLLAPRSNASCCGIQPLVKFIL